MRPRSEEPSDDTLDLLNARVVPLHQLVEPDRYVVLTSTNQAAFEINAERLRTLSGKSLTYLARVDGRFESAAFPTEQSLTLKVGAKVMFVKNDVDGRWINGAWGIVTRRPSIRTADGAVHLVTPSAWGNIEYRYDRKENRGSDRT